MWKQIMWCRNDAKKKRVEMMKEKYLDQRLCYIKCHNVELWNKMMNTTVKRFHCDCRGKNTKFCGKRLCAKMCWKKHRNECLSIRD